MTVALLALITVCLTVTNPLTARTYAVGMVAGWVLVGGAGLRYVWIML